VSLDLTDFTLTGRLPGNIRRSFLAYARRHKAELIDNYYRYQNDQPLIWIED
jgi:hypothetical protein